MISKHIGRMRTTGYAPSNSCPPMIVVLENVIGGEELKNQLHPYQSSVGVEFYEDKRV
jgi:hypothetical protein